MSAEEEVLTNLLDKIVAVQIENATTQKTLVKNIEENIVEIDKLNKHLENTTELIHSNNVITEGLKDVIKEFSIYASNREDADNHLQNSMKLLGEMWQESLNLFTETKYMIEGIHKYSAIVTEERTRILSNIVSKKYDGLTMFQEWMYDVITEVIHSLSPLSPTNKNIEDWIKLYLIEYTRDNTIAQLPQYLDLNGKVKFMDDFHEAIRKEFKLTKFVTTFLCGLCIVFQCTEFGMEFVEHPKLPFVISQLKKYEDVIYE